MEKISRIVSSNSPRVGATDTKNAPAVRPGAPAFGRPVGVSPAGDREDASTAEKVSAIRTDLMEQRKMRNEAKSSADMASRFFEGSKGAPSAGSKILAEEEPHEPTMRATSAERESLISGDTIDLKTAAAPPPQPSKYSPRGSFVDVRA